jgi:hypothetical protein
MQLAALGEAWKYKTNQKTISIGREPELKKK